MKYVTEGNIVPLSSRRKPTEFLTLRLDISDDGAKLHALWQILTYTLELSEDLMKSGNKDVKRHGQKLARSLDKVQDFHVKFHSDYEDY